MLTATPDLSQVLNEQSLPVVFHVLFILSLLASTILFGHCAIRLCMASAPPALRLQQHVRPARHRRRHRLHQHNFPTPTSATDLLSPALDALPTPSAARLASGDAAELYADATPLTSSLVRLDTAGVGTPVLHPSPHDADHEQRLEEGSILIQAPPPAYGRWRGSVRVDPNFLCWQCMTLAERKDDGARVSTVSVVDAPPTYVTDEARGFGEIRSGQSADIEMIEIRSSRR